MRKSRSYEEQTKKWREFIRKLGNEWWEFRGYVVEWPKDSREFLRVMKIEVKQLLDQLDEQTWVLSNPNQMLATEAVKKLLEIKREDLLLIAFSELQNEHSIIVWFEILSRVLNKAPTIPEEQRGKVEYIRKAWLDLLKGEPEIIEEFAKGEDNG